MPTARVSVTHSALEWVPSDQVSTANSAYLQASASGNVFTTLARSGPAKPMELRNDRALATWPSWGASLTCQHHCKQGNQLSAGANRQVAVEPGFKGGGAYELTHSSARAYAQKCMGLHMVVPSGGPTWLSQPMRRSEYSQKRRQIPHITCWAQSATDYLLCGLSHALGPLWNHIIWHTIQPYKPTLFDLHIFYQRSKQGGKGIPDLFVFAAATGAARDQNAIGIARTIKTSLTSSGLVKKYDCSPSFHARTCLPLGPSQTPAAVCPLLPHCSCPPLPQPLCKPQLQDMALITVSPLKTIKKLELTG